MNRRWLVCTLFLAILVLLFVQISSARFDLRVNETATRFSFNELAPEVSVVVENGSTQNLAAVVRLELLKPDNSIVATAERKTTLNKGSQTLLFTLPLNTRDLSPDEESKVLWYRLHYRILPDSTSAGMQPIEGFISLSEITPELFELRVAGTGTARQGMRYQAQVRATHPVTRRPAEGVLVRGAIKLSADDSDEKASLTSSAITNRKGYAILEFRLPADLNADDMELMIEGTRGLLTVKAEKEIDIYTQPYVLVSTDKPLYQPGQLLHARVLVLGPSRRAIATKPVTLKITDPDNTVVFSTNLETSRFGIASAEWAIPDSSRLGDYQLEFTTEDDHSGSANVKISRYELPTFSVNVKTDRPYYLAGQDASVEVKADYLFGQPVTRGHVRLVRETERTWNYREQKYETTEGDKYEGDIGSDGVFKARLSLADDHRKLNEENYRRFTDLSYAAYFTDASTKRTEQRRFNLRLSKEAIHVYLIRPSNRYYENHLLPLRFYVSTFYADGTPAECTVTIREGDGRSSETTRKVTARTKSNRYGLARIEQLRPSASEVQNSEVTFNLRAQDKAGRVGSHAETYQFKEEPAIQVYTTKTLYAAGEPIVATIASSESNLLVTVDVVRDWSVIHSEIVNLRDGRVTITLPYLPEYKDELTIAAYADQGEEEPVVGTRSILYPRNRDLKLNVQSTARTYKPGELAHVSFRATNPEGRSIETALGIVVLDKAVEERVRTDQEFGQRYASFYSEILSLLGHGDAIGVVSRKTLEQLDMLKPISPDLDLAAEVLLNQGSSYYPRIFGSDDYDKSQSNVFSPYIGIQLQPLRKALSTAYDKTRNYPTEESSLRRMLSDVGINFQSLKDPWGTQYRPLFFVERQADVLLLKSAGADKQFDTDDDFAVTRLEWAYFRPIGEAIDAAVEANHKRTGGHIRDSKSLTEELGRLGVNLESLRDRWGKPYEIAFTVNASHFLITITTTTPAGRADGRDVPGETFQLWQSRVDYFAEPRARIDTALAASLKETNHFPQDEVELRTTLQASQIRLDDLRDPWNKPYYVTIHSSASYGDRVRIESQAAVGESARQRIDIKPVTRTITSIKLRSAGEDQRQGTIDDFTVGDFSAAWAEQLATDAKPQAPRVIASFAGSTGAITGTVLDSQGAVVPGASIKATRSESAEVFEATTDDNGKYLLRNLPAGFYLLRIDAPGFKAYNVNSILVRSTTLVEVNAVLDVGGVTETVTVNSAGVETVNISSASVASTVSKTTLFLLAPGVAASKQQISTPRLREYFPETLLWQPELTTDKKGRAQLDFKLADNITTWKMSVIGSTEDGEIGTAETEIRAFQPFFAELDPPRVLTEGDRISLPVVLRNYLDRKQTVDLELKPESWFTILDSNRKRAEVPAGDSSNLMFDLEAVASIKNGKQRVTALGSDLSDAIEKPVTVHPDGEERAETSSDLLQTSADMAVNLPAETIKGSARVELKVYPNLMAHVWESVEGIMQRPYGCGEQTISSTYPSLLVLRYLKKEAHDSPIAEKARRYVQAGYQRLLGYQSDDGGFTYWGRGNSDTALTAYAIRFLHDASEVIPVNEYALQRARSWLITQQRADGSWPALNWDHKEEPTRTAMVTAVVARSLALTQPKQNARAPNTTDSTRGSLPQSELNRALDYLQTRSDEIDEPYLIASYSLASALVGDFGRASLANTRLNKLAHRESTGTYWSLETNTPFYGWGVAGRVETTALAVQALAHGKFTEPQALHEKKDLESRGLLFLLRNKDRYGVWYSTQATINVLDAMLSLLAEQSSPPGSAASSKVDVLVNGQPATSLELPSGSRMIAPLIADLSAFVKTGINRIELRRAGSGPVASLQVVSTYYVPWANELNTDTARARSGESESLRLETSFDKKEARVTDEITCRVKAERIGVRGYGMLLAEIGLPPGADVDRASLETAMRGSDWSINQYDVLPDRVVVYLWPRAGGSSFSFKFKPRLAMTAKSAASVVYDYYNPEARVVVAPTGFVVRKAMSDEL